VGNVCPNKRQAELARILRGKVNVDFVGPMSDPIFRSNSTCRYIGEWSKHKLYNRLTEYSCLVLLSAAEGAPLVVPEALAAGLSLVLSPAAAANLSSKPYISITPEDISEETIADYVIQQIDQNLEQRHTIRNYAREYFDWSRIVEEYLCIVEEFREHHHAGTNPH
jgi:glycosyltransferase involved in cell wall biosynthesis